MTRTMGKARAMAIPNPSPIQRERRRKSEGLLVVWDSVFGRSSPGSLSTISQSGSFFFGMDGYSRKIALPGQEL